MALFEPCRYLVRLLSVLPMKCQVLSAPKFCKKPPNRGYVRQLYQYSRQSSTKRGTTDKSMSQFNQSSSTDCNISPDHPDITAGDLDLYIDLLSLNLKNEQVFYEYLLTALRLFSIQLNKKHTRNNEDSKNTFQRNSEQNGKNLMTDGDFYSIQAKTIAKNREKPEIFLLSCCGNDLWSFPFEHRQKLVHQVWNLIVNHLEKVTLSHYHVLLTICMENRQDIEPAAFIGQMVVSPVKETYVLLMKIAGKTGDLQASEFVLKKMKELDFFLSFDTLTSLLEVYCTIGDIKQALMIIDRITEAGIEPDNEMWSCLAKAYAVNGDLTTVIELSNQFNFKTHDLCEIIDILLKSVSIEDIFKFLDTLTRKKLAKIAEHSVFIAAVMNLIRNSSKIDEASKILQFFIENKRDFNVNNKVDEKNCEVIDNELITEEKLMKLIVYYLKTLVNSNVDEKIILDEFFSIKNSGKFEKKSLDLFLIGLLEVSLRKNRTKLASSVLDEFSVNKTEIRTHFFWPLFVEFSKIDGEAGIFKVIEKMQKFRVKVDFETLLWFVLPRINTISPTRTLKKLTNVGLTKSTASTALSCYLLDVGRLEAASALVSSSNCQLDFQKIVESLTKSIKNRENVKIATKILKKAPRNSVFAGKFLQGLLTGKHSEKINEGMLNNILESFAEEKIAISHATANFLADEINITSQIAGIISNRCNVSDGEGLSGIPHPKDMEIDDLEAHLIELKSKNLNIRGLLRKLFIAHCKAGNLDRVEEIRTEFKRLGEKLQPGMQAHLFEIYAKNGEISKLCKVILDLQTNHPKFQIDSFKILIAAKALVDQGKIEMALEIMKNCQEASRTANFESFLLLDAIARGEKSHFLQKTLEILKQKKFCNVNSEIMGTIIRPFLIRRDWESAVRMMEEFAEFYSIAPLKQELLSALIEVEREEMVQKVIKCIGKLHGTEAVIRHLIIAYGKHGKIGKIRDLLETHEISKIPALYFSKATPCEVKAEVLSNILEATQESQIIDLEYVYESLLLTYLELGDNLAANSLWRRLQNDTRQSIVYKQKFERILTSWTAASKKRHTNPIN